MSDTEDYSDTCGSLDKWSDEDSSDSAMGDFIDDSGCILEDDNSYQEKEEEDDTSDDEEDTSIIQEMPNSLKRRIDAVEGSIEQGTPAKSSRVESGIF